MRDWDWDWEDYLRLSIYQSKPSDHRNYMRCSHGPRHPSQAFQSRTLHNLPTAKSTLSASVSEIHRLLALTMRVHEERPHAGTPIAPSVDTLESLVEADRNIGVLQVAPAIHVELLDDVHV